MSDIILAKKNSFIANLPDCNFTMIELSDDITVAFMDNLSRLKINREQILGLLDKDYLCHVQKFYDADYRLLSATCYLMLRKLYPYDISIKFTANGKPYDEDGKIFFSFSHTENACAIAILKKNIGIDIANIMPYDADIARLICSDDEKEKLDNALEKNILLSELITQKESYIKLTDSTLSSIMQTNIKQAKFITINLSPNVICTVCL